jgi:hypothetical protein
MDQINKLLLAQTPYHLSGPGIATDKASSVGQLEKIISSVIGIMTIFGAIYFTIQIILSGFSMISSQGDPKELETGKKRLTNNILGLAIIVLAYGLTALITKLLGIDNVFNLKNLFLPANVNPLTPTNSL